MASASHTGRLLVATPLLSDGIFDRAVVYVLEHTEDGAMGLVLNQPSTTPVGDASPAWVGLAAPPHRVFVGGPVEPGVGFGLGRGVAAAAAAGWTALGDGVGLVDLSRDPEQLAGSITEVRLFAGYAGWAPGQLEAELGSGAWHTVAARPSDPFSGTPEQLWRDVLRRQSGPIALLATYPPDPRSN